MTTAQSVMSKKIISVRTGTRLADAEALMQEKRIHHLPVVDPSGFVVGVFSLKDMVYADDKDEIAVDSVLNTPAVHVDQNMSLRSAIFKFLEKKVSCLLISDEHNQAVGILTTDDLLWYLAHLLKEEDEQSESFFDTKAWLNIGQIAQKISDAGL